MGNKILPFVRETLMPVLNRQTGGVFPLYFIFVANQTEL